LFVDYAGTTLDVIDGTTGEVLNAQLFVAALGASSYTWAEATWTQGLGDWIGSHTRAFVFYGGVAAMTVRQPQVRHHQGVLLRSGGEPQLRRDGRPLRHGDRSGAPIQAAR
jgi:transposase